MVPLAEQITEKFMIASRAFRLLQYAHAPLHRASDTRGHTSLCLRGWKGLRLEVTSEQRTDGAAEVGQVERSRKRF